MEMVFCRGCGKEIHVTAPTCPHCGAPQAIAEHAAPRTTARLIGWAAVWTIVFWFGSLFLAGAIVGMMHPGDAAGASERAGEVLTFPMFLVAVCLSAGLTVIGKLPGTRKPSLGARTA